MASLYEINEQIMQCIDLETGEILDEDRLKQLQMDKKQKLENVALWYKNLLSDAEAYKAEKNSFADREKRARSKAESLKRYLDMELSGNKFSTERVDISYRKSKTLEYDGQTEVPTEYLKYADPTINKEAIKEALKDGQHIAGFTIKENNNIQIK